jgi:hypothetical protein
VKFTAAKLAVAVAILYQAGWAAAQSALPSYPYVACPTTKVTKLSPVGNTTTSADFDAIQKALNAASTQGGGTVVLNPGTYAIVSQVPLVIKSNVTLCAPSGATLKYVGATSGQLLVPGTIYSDTPANNSAILNLTFDNGIVLLQGDKVRFERNTIQNITTFAATNTSVWGGSGGGPLSNATILHNRFSNLTRTGFMGYTISNSLIKENTFENVAEPIHIFDIWASKVVGNFGTGTRRMAIEIQRNTTTPDASLPGLVISDNRFVNWVADANQDNVIALSIVAGQSAEISRNTLICGSGCFGSTKGWGMEIAGSGTTKIQGNTVQAFALGIGIAAPTESVNVVQNAIYDADVAITKFNNGYTTKSYLIDSNHIENARSSGISASDWYMAYNPVLQNNVIIRKAGYWAGDSTRSYSAIGSAGLAADSAPMVIQNNVLLFEGAAVPGFSPTGIFLAGYNGNLTGTNISNNRIGTDGVASYGQAINLNSWGSSTGVKLTNNKFQNLSNVVTGVPENGFVATGNTAVNMSGSAISPSSLAPNQQVAFPTIGITPGSATGTGPLKVKFSATGSQSFVPYAWLAGDGTLALTSATATSPTSSVSYTYLLSAVRKARLLSLHPSGAVALSGATVNEK